MEYTYIYKYIMPALSPIFIIIFLLVLHAQVVITSLKLRVNTVQLTGHGELS